MYTLKVTAAEMLQENANIISMADLWGGLLGPAL